MPDLAALYERESAIDLITFNRPNRPNPVGLGLFGDFMAHPVTAREDKKLGDNTHRGGPLLLRGRGLNGNRQGQGPGRLAV